MVQGNRDVEQDVRDILRTRDELTQKIQLLKSRTRGAVREIRYNVTDAIYGVNHSAEAVHRTLTGFQNLYRHPWALAVTGLVLGSLLAALRVSRHNGRHPVLRHPRQPDRMRHEIF